MLEISGIVWEFYRHFFFFAVVLSAYDFRVTLQEKFKQR